LSQTLFIIPARGGSKGVPRKNVKPLGGKPLIQYTIEVARKLTEDKNICVSTDDEEIKLLVEGLGLHVPFIRPAELATDSAGTHGVLLHALEFYQLNGYKYERLVLLQPTSPFRESWQVKQALDSWEEGLEMIVSVKKTKSNPYYLLFEENADGYLTKSKEGNFVTRQECPIVYELNGAIYIIDVGSLLTSPISAFTRIKKFLMDETYSLDIDTPMDWIFAEFLLSQKPTWNRTC
jgi:N-acylneuraminate cytidylyltransferase